MSHPRLTAGALSKTKVILQVLEKAAKAIPAPAKGPVKAIAGGVIDLIKLREVWVFP
jgi:hypothetical protein